MKKNNFWSLPHEFEQFMLPVEFEQFMLPHEFEQFVLPHEFEQFVLPHELFLLLYREINNKISTTKNIPIRIL